MKNNLLKYFIKKRILIIAIFLTKNKHNFFVGLCLVSLLECFKFTFFFKHQAEVLLSLADVIEMLVIHMGVCRWVMGILWFVSTVSGTLSQEL